MKILKKILSHSYLTSKDFYSFSHDKLSFIHQLKVLSSLAVIFNPWKYQNCVSHHVMNRKFNVFFDKYGIIFIFSLVHCTHENIKRFCLASEINNILCISQILYSNCENNKVFNRTLFLYFHSCFTLMKIWNLTHENLYFLSNFPRIELPLTYKQATPSEFIPSAKTGLWWESFGTWFPRWKTVSVGSGWKAWISRIWHPPHDPGPAGWPYSRLLLTPRTSARC